LEATPSIHSTSTHARAGYCHACHQRIATQRLGVRLPPLKAAILDKIKAAGDLGITSAEIIADLYPDRRPVSATTIKAHVFQIGDCPAGCAGVVAADRVPARACQPPASGGLE
jgi:hypothetical protein